jgi:hypothetical protein
MSYYVGFFLNLLILIPAITGWIRYKHVDPVFFPFLVFIWVGTAFEVINHCLITLGFYNIVPLNIYFLLESLVSLWIFNKWTLFSNKLAYLFFIFIFIAAWLAENVIVSKFYLGFNSYFHIFYEFIIVLMSVNMINVILLNERGRLWKNPMFLISACFVLFHTLGVLTEAFMAYGIKFNPNLARNVNRIVAILNTICYFIYTLAILWMPKRQAFSLQY